MNANPRDVVDQSSLERLRVVTWNIWFTPFERETRTAALLQELARFDADVVALQEVLPETLALIAADPWVREHFTLSDTTGETLGDYGVVVQHRSRHREWCCTICRPRTDGACS